MEFEINNLPEYNVPLTDGSAWSVTREFGFTPCYQTTTAYNLTSSVFEIFTNTELLGLSCHRQVKISRKSIVSIEEIDKRPILIITSLLAMLLALFGMVIGGPSAALLMMFDDSETVDDDTGAIMLGFIECLVILALAMVSMCYNYYYHKVYVNTMSGKISISSLDHHQVLELSAKLFDDEV